MNCIPCIEWYSEKTKNMGDIDLLAEVCVCNKIEAQKMSEYSQLLAHSYAIYDSIGYNKEEIANCIDEKDKRKNYCSTRYKSSEEGRLLCEICEYSKQYLGKRAEMERTVLYYLIAHNTESSKYQGTEKNMFVSKTIIKRQGDMGKWPIIELHREIYNFIFINTFSGIIVNKENFLETFMQYIYANIPMLAEKFDKNQEDIRDAFSKIAGIFIGNYREIEESEYDEALACISVPYKEFLKTLKIDKEPSENKRDKPARPQKKPETGARIVDLKVPDDIKQGMDELLHLDTSLVGAYSPMTPQKKNYSDVNTTPEESAEQSAEKQSHTNFPEEPTEIIPTAAHDDQESIESSEPEPDCKEYDVEEKSEPNCEQTIPVISSPLLTLDGVSVREINYTVMSELIIRIVRSRTLIMEVARFGDETGIAFYPDYSAFIYFSSDMECIKNLLKQIPKDCSIITFDSKLLFCYLRKYSIRCDRTAHLICLKLLYNTKQKTKVDNLQDIVHDVIGNDERIDSSYSYLMLEQRVYYALWNRLMSPDEISNYEYNEIINRAQSFSYHFSDSDNDIIPISEYQARAGINCFKIKIETGNAAVWKKNISKIICRMYASRVFDSFKLYISECKNNSMILHFLSPYKDEVIDTMWHILGSTIGKILEDKLDLSIVDLSSKEMTPLIDKANKDESPAAS